MGSGLQEIRYLAAYGYWFKSHLRKKKKKRGLKGAALICIVEEQAVCLCWVSLVRCPLQKEKTTPPVISLLKCLPTAE